MIAYTYTPAYIHKHRYIYTRTVGEIDVFFLVGGVAKNLELSLKLSKPINMVSGKNI